MLTIRLIYIQYHKTLATLLKNNSSIISLMFPKVYYAIKPSSNTQLWFQTVLRRTKICVVGWHLVKCKGVPAMQSCASHHHSHCINLASLITFAAQIGFCEHFLKSTAIRCCNVHTACREPSTTYRRVSCQALLLFVEIFRDIIASYTTFLDAALITSNVTWDSHNT